MDVTQKMAETVVVYEGLFVLRPVFATRRNAFCTAQKVRVPIVSTTHRSLLLKASRDGTLRCALSAKSSAQGSVFFVLSASSDWLGTSAGAKRSRVRM
jgi:hypothetical protein